MVVRHGRFVPDRGDLIWLDFQPSVGRKQRGRRPALVLSPRAYNERAGLAVVCPLTSQQKGYPFEVYVGGTRIKGVVLADQIRALDWNIRKAKFIEKAHSGVVSAVQQKLLSLLFDQ